MLLSSTTKLIIDDVLKDVIPDADSTAAVTLFLGANDASLKDINPKMHVPLWDYIENLTWLTNRYIVDGLDVILSRSQAQLGKSTYLDVA